MTKCAFTDALATQCRFGEAMCGKLVNSFAERIAVRIKRSGVRTAPAIGEIMARTVPVKAGAKNAVTI
eukprot:6124452-Lingulodinium_polyedra.AAC.1